jgi:hypothetical protein
MCCDSADMQAQQGIPARNTLLAPVNLLESTSCYPGIAQRLVPVILPRC